MTTFGYIILWRGKKYEKTVVKGPLGIYGVKEEFCNEHRIPPKRRHEVSIYLAEKNGQPVVHAADF